MKTLKQSKMIKSFNFLMKRRRRCKNKRFNYNRGCLRIRKNKKLLKKVLSKRVKMKDKLCKS